MIILACFVVHGDSLQGLFAVKDANFDFAKLRISIIPLKGTCTAIRRNRVVRNYTCVYLTLEKLKYMLHLKRKVLL